MSQQPRRESGYNSCNYCRGLMTDARVIAGSPSDRKQFCSYACYESWKAAEDSRNSS
jgi:hypothetical protein